LLAGLERFDALFARLYRDWKLADLEAQYVKGDPVALLAAVGKCLATDTPTPEWVRCGFLGAFCAYRYGIVRTLDEAFHVQRPSNWRRKRTIKDRLDWELWRRVEDYRAQNPREGSSKREVFEIVAAEFNTEYAEKFRGIEEAHQIEVNWRDVEKACKRTQFEFSKTPRI
jgi:hypothetical protein